MCRNHHDLPEMAVIESLPLRHVFKHLPWIKSLLTPVGVQQRLMQHCPLVALGRRSFILKLLQKKKSSLNSCCYRRCNLLRKLSWQLRQNRIDRGTRSVQQFLDDRFDHLPSHACFCCGLKKMPRGNLPDLVVRLCAKSHSKTKLLP